MSRKGNNNGQSRRKNVCFKPEGKDRLHDTAVNILTQHGRGMCDFISEAVVYYTAKLAEGSVEPEFFKNTVGRVPKRRVLYVGNLMGAGAADSNKNNPISPIPPNLTEYDHKEAAVVPDNQNQYESVQPVTEDAPAVSENQMPSGQQGISDSLLEELVMDFGNW